MASPDPRCPPVGTRVATPAILRPQPTTATSTIAVWNKAHTDSMSPMRKKLCSFWSTMSVWYPPPLPPDPSHHQAVISWQLTTSLHPWVRYIWLKVWWDDHWHPALAVLVPSGLPWGPWCQLGPHCDLQRSLITERHSGLDWAGHSSQSCPSRSHCQVTKQDYGVPSQNTVWHRPRDSKKWLLLCPHKLNNSQDKFLTWWRRDATLSHTHENPNTELWDSTEPAGLPGWWSSDHHMGQ